jgi:hypothetical protein
LSLEGFSIQKNNFLPAIVHELGEHDHLDAATLGMFLNKNSKDFSQKVRENMKYQDLVRFCVSTISNQTKGSEVAVKDYLKLALKEFSKGRSNWSLFISLASLPASYLTKFEQFIALFERGALFGQKLSGRQLCNVDKKRKRKESLKLEIPVTMLKLHMKVGQDARESLIDDILNKKMGYSEYCKSLKHVSEIDDVKKLVEGISKSSFKDVHEKQPEFFSEIELTRFVGARNTPTGPNEVYTNLVKHVNVAFGNQSKDEVRSDQSVVFTPSDNLNLYSLVNKMKTFKVIVLALGEESIADGLYCIKERIKESTDAVGILINIKDEEKVKEDLALTYSDSGVIVEFIHVKRKSPIVENGFKKELESVAVFGDKSCFKDKVIKTLYGGTVKAALHSVISDIVVGNEKVLYCFTGEAEAFDLDPLGTLARKRIQLEYLGTKTVIESLADKLNMKVV